MNAQEKLIRLAMAVLEELKRMPSYNDEAEDRLRAARNGHHLLPKTATRLRPAPGQSGPAGSAGRPDA